MPGCLACGDLSPVDLRFCLSCGAAVPQKAEVSTRCATCGDQSPVGSRFCITCGSATSLAAVGETRRISHDFAVTGQTRHLIWPLVPRWLKGLLLFGIVIMVLYSTLILLPSYESGMAWLPYSPGEEFRNYEPWYFRALPLAPTGLGLISGLLIILTVVATALMAWYILLPLGIFTVLYLRAKWPELPQRTRVSALLIGLAEIVVPVLTWAASHHFMYWFSD